VGLCQYTGKMDFTLSSFPCERRVFPACLPQLPAPFGCPLLISKLLGIACKHGVTCSQRPPYSNDTKDLLCLSVCCLQPGSVITMSISLTPRTPLELISSASKQIASAPGESSQKSPKRASKMLAWLIYLMVKHTCCVGDVLLHLLDTDLFIATRTFLAWQKHTNTILSSS
jgi:hypothetical protein